ncbi:MAG: hypothetical protein ACREUX_23770 [Burkholderiales bacterium]
MVMKVIAGIIAVVLVVAFVLPPAVKLKEPALIVVITLGIVLMLIDLWQSLKERD